MIEAVGDLWTYPADARCVTTNGVVRANGELVMGKGVALEAARRYPGGRQVQVPVGKGKFETLTFQGVARWWGSCVRKWGNHPFVFTDGAWAWLEAVLVSFPTKENWTERAQLWLIERSARRIAGMADLYRWKNVVLTRPGCGNGGLRWETVKPLLAPVLDDRFVVLTPG